MLFERPSAIGIPVTVNNNNYVLYRATDKERTELNNE